MADITDQTESEQSEAIRDAVANDVASGIASTTVDGLSVQTMHPMTRLDVADRIKRNARANNPFAGMRTVKLVPPGGGN